MEGAILLALQHLRLEGLTQALVLLGSFANGGLIWIIMGIVFCVFASRRRTGMLMIVSIIVVWIVGTLIISHIIGRPRPTDAVQGLVAVMGVAHDGYSLPNFVAGAAAASVVTIGQAGESRLAMPCFIYGVIVCILQMFFGVAYLTDVVAGVALGVVVALLVERFSYRFSFDISSLQRPLTRKSAHKGSKGRHSL